MVGLYLAPIATILPYTEINHKRHVGTTEYNWKSLTIREPLLSKEIHFMGNIRDFWLYIHLKAFGYKNKYNKTFCSYPFLLTYQGHF